MVVDIVANEPGARRMMSSRDWTIAESILASIAIKLSVSTWTGTSFDSVGGSSKSVESKRPNGIFDCLPAVHSTALMEAMSAKTSICFLRDNAIGECVRRSVLLNSRASDEPPINAIFKVVRVHFGAMLAQPLCYVELFIRVTFLRKHSSLPLFG